MKAAVIHEYGGPLSYEDVPDPVTGPGEVLIEVAAAGVNNIDIIERNGGTKDERPLHFPAILGWDVSGTIVALGVGIEGLVVGEKVVAWANHTYAERVVAKADLFARLPDGLDLVDAAAVPLAAVTGSELVTQGAVVKPWQTVLVSGATGSVGRAAVYTAKNLGARVVAGVTRRQLDVAKHIGADEILALDDETAFAAQPQVDVIANTVRGATAAALMKKAKDGGTFATVTGPPSNAKDFPKVNVAAFYSNKDAELLGILLQAVRDKKFAMPIDRRIPLRDAGAAQDALAKGGLHGKILLLP